MNHALTLPGIGDLVDGRFRIDRKLGEGGTSTVYEVSHVITDRKFAIKWLLPELALEDAAVDRFIHEARVGSKFAHPHAVQVYDICRANDSFYMLMELLQGESLQARLERMGRLSVQEACAIVLTCADVLSAAHRSGIIHRDLKPANIFLCSDSDGPAVPKLLDFGISTFCSDLQSMSLTATPRGSVIGTPLYMSPEQMLGQAIDQRADIYALGAVLYELISGQPPYQADSYAELVVKVTVEARPTPLEQLAPVERQFAAIVARAMARRPEHRYGSVEELIFAIRPYAGSNDASGVRAISAAAKPQGLESSPAPRPPASRQRLEVSRIGLWAGTFVLVGAAVATVGARVFERPVAGVAVTSSRPSDLASDAPNQTATPRTPRKRPPPGPWERAASSEVLTGSAAPAVAAPQYPLHTGALQRRARVARQLSPSPGSGAAAAAQRHAASSRSKLGAPSQRRDAADRPEHRAADRQDRQDPQGADRTTSATNAAPAEERAPKLTPGRVQLRRADFGSSAAAVSPASAAPPQVGVSRDDF